MLEIVFPRFQILKFSGEHTPAPPKKSRLRREQPNKYRQKSSGSFPTFSVLGIYSNVPTLTDHREFIQIHQQC